MIRTKSFTLATYEKGNRDSEKLALVFPGKLDSKDYAHMRSHVDCLAGLGFYALTFDEPGVWESPGDISLFTTSNYIKAVNELIEYFGNRPTFLVGHSRGASVAVITGVKNPNVFAFTSIIPSFSKDGFDHTDDPEWKNSGYKVEMRDLPPGGGEKTKEFRLPYGFFEDQIKFRWTKDISESKKPKLLFLGKKDTLTPAE